MNKAVFPILPNRLPGRLNMEQTATLLGFQPHDIPPLIKVGLLKPLGTPVANSIKYFAAVTIGELANDERWLSKATKAVSDRWKHRNYSSAEPAVEP